MDRQVHFPWHKRPRTWGDFQAIMPRDEGIESPIDGLRAVDLKT